MSTSEKTITRRDALLAAGAVGAVGAAAVGTAGVIGLARGEKRDTAGLTLRAPRISKVPEADPEAEAWAGAPDVVLALQAQRVAPPRLETLAVAELRARALHDGKRLAFRLSWEDESVDDLDGVGRYHDAVAVMLPVRKDANPAITMGTGDVPVHILQWRATWERDLAGKTGVDQIHPNVVHDVMPDDVLPEATADLYWVGRTAGNPLSQVKRTTSVEQIVAAGPGTSTHIASSDATGKGVHDGATWTVSISLPLARPEGGDRLEPGSTWQAAFAVWRGDQRNRGSRKHYADWVPLVLEATL
ncbi:MAG: ethylbenzene dehydrogenase-related protein [Gaiella sp.]